MGNLFGGKETSTNVLIMGQKGAGKTHLLYNFLQDEQW